VQEGEVLLTLEEVVGFGLGFGFGFGLD